MEDAVQEAILVAIAVLLASSAIYYYAGRVSTGYIDVFDSAFEPVSLLAFYDNSPPPSSGLNEHCTSIDMYIPTGFTVELKIKTPGGRPYKKIKYVVDIYMPTSKAGEHIEDYVSSILAKLKDKYPSLIRSWDIEEDREGTQAHYTVIVDMVTTKTYQAYAETRATRIDSTVTVCFSYNATSTITTIDLG